MSAHLSSVSRRFCEDRIWDVLTPEQMAQLDTACVIRKCARGSAVFQQDARPEGLYCIRKGQVLLTQTDQFGNEIAFRIAVGGEVIGYRSLFADQPHAATARALATTTVRFVPRGVLRDLRTRNHALDGAFLRAVASDSGFVDAPLLRNPLLPLRIRFAYLLTVLHRHHGHRESTMLRYDVALTQRDTGALLGARPETIARMHRSFEEEGLCCFRRSEIQVLDYPGVLKILGFGKSSHHRRA